MKWAQVSQLRMLYVEYHLLMKQNGHAPSKKAVDRQTNESWAKKFQQAISVEFPELLAIADKTQNVQLSTLTFLLGSSTSHPLRLGDFLNCIFSFLSAGKMPNDPREPCLCVWISCNLPLSCCEVTGVYTKL